MTVDDEQSDSDSEDSAAKSVVEISTSTLGDVTIPAPIRKNLFKALDRLCSALIDVPVAHLEDKAAAVRADTAARAFITKKSAEKIASEMQVDQAYVRLASEKFTSRIVREQLNLDQISAAAAREIQKEARVSESGGSKDDGVNAQSASLSDDWLNVFQREASSVSSDEMQLLFSRVLAGEISRPSSFSIKTVKTLAELDQATAATFVRLCSVTIQLVVPSRAQVLDARACSLGGNAGSNALQQYGLGFGTLNQLAEHGLIISDYHSWYDYSIAVAKGRQVAIPIAYQGKLWGLVPVESEKPKKPDVKVNGVAFTKAGLDLLRIVDKVAVKGYDDALTEYFMSQSYKLTLIDN